MMEKPCLIVVTGMPGAGKTTFSRALGEALFLPVYLVEFGLLGALARLVSGIPFSVAHCAGNFVIVLALYHPLKRVFARLAAG